ncbi:hypothetical protein LTR78_006848 [Recurvomyces mirabilis]|uniref:Uncharacterized protein n=1 Tax=Recurvomyces mirabilis TaxID=574656 RepID=A0AAE0WKB5_9PEZI|nr:hypothetical protein LTR78_006848 [Recurvomyces mirabilis]KAK5153161.1 ferrochelatase hem15 [Recurvomyces mirabilis]
MLDIFRRGRMAVRAQQHNKIILDSFVDQQGNSTKASFLGLPSELRNAVYERLATDMVLSPVVPSKRRRRPPPLSVLLVCKQIHFEVRDVLLANARIHFQAPNYDFTGLTSSIEAMPCKTLQALISNTSLYVRLVVDNAPNRSQLDHISAWLAYRANAVQDTGSRDGDVRDVGAHQLVFHYDAIVAILAAILRQLPLLGTEECFEEKSRMYRGLAMYKNRLVGLLEDTDVEMPVRNKSDSSRDLMPQVWVPQYR